jgi:dTDP-4-amino-4,6-dideoxygalactose transaminase
MSTYNIPLFNLNYGEEEIETVTETIRSKWISMGPKCIELEKMFQDMFDVKYACAVTNCTAALHLACYALGIGEGDEVICPSLTFAATVNCIKYVGATPVFCDVEGYDNFGLSAGNIEKLITPRTKAIIPMHYAGFPCDMDSIMEIARKHNLYVIEDACHGPLSEYKGKKIGTIGDVGCFSFFSNKNISTGEGGMVVTNNEEVYNKIKLARSHGMTTMSYQRASGHATSYDIETLGFNYRLDDIRASLACVQLKKLKDDLIKRLDVRKLYEELLGNVDGITIPYTNNSEFVSNYIFPILLKNSNRDKREKFRTLLQEKGIQTSVHYPAVHRFSMYTGLKAELPNTEYIADNEVTLPMYAALTVDEIKYICQCVREVLEGLK